MGRLFQAILVIAPVAAFAIWAWFYQTGKTEARIDERELRFEQHVDTFDRDFDRAIGAKPDPAREQRIANREKDITEARDKRKALTQQTDAARQEVDGELQKFNKEK